jgi:NarL family two-component system response regulator LiaR
MTVTVLVVDDHGVVRQGLGALIATAPDLAVAGTAGSGEEAVRQAAALQPDVVLLDLILAGETGVQVLPRLKMAAPATRVLMLTSYTEGDLVEPALAAGADGYLLKTASAEGVLDAIRLVARGQQVMDPAATTALRELAGTDLSGREREVLHLVAEGLSNAEIAERLTITVRTVKAHISSLLQKLKLSDRTQLAIYALHQRMRREPWGQGPPSAL